MNEITFEKPNGRTLEAIDTYMQSSKFENDWERCYNVMDMFPGEGSGWGWSGIKKARPQSFLKAWYAAQIFMIEKQISQQEIIDHPYGL